MSMFARCLTLLVAVVIISAAGCKKEEFTTRTGYIINSGEFVDGGCGWILSVSAELQYQPNNLPLQYQQDSLAVLVTYKDLNSRPDCPSPANIEDKIYIHKIELAQ